MACAGLIASYAYYQVIDEQPIIGGTITEIPDFDLRIYVENRTTGKYVEYDYVPMSGYTYNSAKSYCTNGSTITYNTSTKDITVNTDKHELCYAYFDATDAVLDLTLNVFIENTANDGTGNGTYTKVVDSTIPSVGYTLNTTTSYCTNSSSITYLPGENMISITGSGQDECFAYLDVLPADIEIVIKTQRSSGSETYDEVSSIPSDKFYDLNSSSACTGGAEITLENQKVFVEYVRNSACIVLLDIGSGPIISEVTSSNVTTTGATINITNAANSTAITSYKYSIDNGSTYQTANSSTITLSGLSSNTNYNVLIYGIDANNKTSAIKSVSFKTN